MWSYASVVLEGLHPYQGGYLRRKYRKDRRPELPVESPLAFYPRYVGNVIYKHYKLVRTVVRYYGLAHRLRRDPAARDYMDVALTPVMDDDFDSLEMFKTSDAAKSAAMKVRGHSHAPAPQSDLVKIGG